jgi:hypothetical protein
MIDLKNFTLGSTKVSIQRYTGTYTDGIYVRTLASTITTWASVQPYSTVEADEIFEASAGESIEQIRWMYTTEKVYLNDNTVPANATTDLIVVEGVTYKPTKVEEWQHLSIPHYAVLLRKFDGY